MITRQFESWAKHAERAKEAKEWKKLVLRVERVERVNQEQSDAIHWEADAGGEESGELGFLDFLAGKSSKPPRSDAL